ncbi:hypothetical protein ACFWCH_06765 [Microbacterium sp. NPDC060132]|uniref:hypothetical protein n=1 Tax=unclassified Microbacterium TaxID=2609290 RepID=UPI00364A5274
MKTLLHHASKRDTVLSGLVVVVLLLAPMSPARADVDSPSPLDALESANPASVVSAVEEPMTSEGLDATIGTVSLSVPADAAAGISVGVGSGEIGIGLPFASNASDGFSEASGTVTFDNQNGTKTVAVVQASGRLQVASVLSGPSSPTSYEYPIDLPSGASLQASDGGINVVDNATGEVLGVFAAPWAEDAEGRSVPTRYEVRDSSIIQVVEHRSAAYSYPVIADPTYTTSVIYLSRAQVINMYKGLKNINNICGLFPIPYPAGIACAGLAPAAEVEKAYWQKLRIKVTYYNCGFNYCSYTTFKAVR